MTTDRTKAAIERVISEIKSPDGKWKPWQAAICLKQWSRAIWSLDISDTIPRINEWLIALEDATYTDEYGTGIKYQVNPDVNDRAMWSVIAADVLDDASLFEYACRHPWYPGAGDIGTFSRVNTHGVLAANGMYLLERLR